jgi:hypothetical protein
MISLYLKANVLGSVTGMDFKEGDAMRLLRVRGGGPVLKC